MRSVLVPTIRIITRIAINTALTIPSLYILKIQKETKGSASPLVRNILIIAVNINIKTIGFIPFNITLKEIPLIKIIIAVKSANTRKAIGVDARNTATINTIARIILVLGSRR